MTTAECIRQRVSCRRFQETPIPREDIRRVVDLARFSPSWKNTQVVRYHVVKNADLKEKIAQNCVLGFDFNAKTIVRCNALVIVSVVTKVSGYEPDGSMFDIYHVSPHETDNPDEFVTEVCFPVKRK